MGERDGRSGSQASRKENKVGEIWAVQGEGGLLAELGFVDFRCTFEAWHVLGKSRPVKRVLVEVSASAVAATTAASGQLQWASG